VLSENRDSFSWVISRMLILGILSAQLVFAATSNANIVEDISHNTAHVDKYYAMNKEMLPYEGVVELATTVIANRQYYDKNTIAKMFILLADTAINKGALAKAMQFAQDGLTIEDIAPELVLNLKLKIIQGQYAQGKFHQAKQLSIEAVALSRELDSTLYRLLALSYRAMTNALVGEHALAFADLQEVDDLLKAHQEFSEHIEVIEILALSRFYLEDFDSAITLYNRVLKLRYDLNMKQNVEKTYYSLATTYLMSDRLDDAYNGYWEAKKYAELADAPIRIAYAHLGLGQVLHRMNNYEEAQQELLQAEALFSVENLSKPYLDTLITLAKNSLALSLEEDYQTYLHRAMAVAENTELTTKQISLFSMLSSLYAGRGEYQKAFLIQSQYIDFLLKQRTNIVYTSPVRRIDDSSDKSRQLALDLAEASDLRQYYGQKYQGQMQLIFGLVTLASVLGIALIYFWLRSRSLEMTKKMDEVDQRIDAIASPSQTKYLYQHNFKMARKYEFPLAIGYLSIDNWQEMTFQFNKKTIDEVAKTMALLINEQAGEFDSVGLINDGEYLILCPHQQLSELQSKLMLLSKALQARFFANLGDFSVKISYAFDSPGVQDIDPYIFLSRLSESTRAEYTQFKT